LYQARPRKVVDSWHLAARHTAAQVHNGKSGFFSASFAPRCRCQDGPEVEHCFKANCSQDDPGHECAQCFLHKRLFRTCFGAT
jgi:hypothetical protein